MNNTLKFILSLIITLAIGFSGSLFTRPEINGWFQTISKPSWNPPDYVFAPVWTTLYILMGIALFLVWKSGANNRMKKPAFILFSIQLLLNFLWSLIFFNRHEIGWAMIDIILLWILILLTVFSFAKINKTAAWLLVPYISWVSFAAILNFTIWKMN